MADPLTEAEELRKAVACVKRYVNAGVYTPELLTVLAFAEQAAAELVALRREREELREEVKEGHIQHENLLAQFNHANDERGAYIKSSAGLKNRSRGSGLLRVRENHRVDTYRPW